MSGKVFPKTFKFTGWHPGCRCFATAVQPTEEEMDRLADMTEEEEEQAYLQKKQVKTMPKEFTKWIDDNAERIANAKNIPYFIKDNYVDGDISKGFKWEQEAKPVKVKPVKGAKAKNDGSAKVDNNNPTSKTASVQPQVSAEDEALLRMQSEQKHREEILAKAKQRQEKRKPAEIERIKERAAIRQEELALYSHEQRVMFREIEKELHIERGFSMTYEQADKQSANPLWQPEFLPDKNGRYINKKGERFTKNPKYKKGYTINCQTCSPVYQLRLWGFDVTAGANTPKSLSRTLSGAREWQNCWLNKDGSKVSYLSFRDWVYRKYNQYNMNENLYMEYFNEQCKDVGIYEIGLTWKKGGGHCTMIERKADGTLRYIEPQKDNSKGSEDEWKDIGYLCREMTNVARSYDGVVRCDNKLFNVKDWIGIVKIIKRKR